MSEKKKIIIVGPGYPYRNGQSVYLGSLCQKLSGKFNIELINFSMLYPAFLFPGKTQYDESKDRKVRYPNTRMLHSLNPVSWYKTAKYINRQQPDLIAIDWWHPFLGPCFNGLIRFLSPKNKKKILFITENVISHEANKTDNFLTRLALKHAQAFLALSESVERHLKRMFNVKVYRSALPVYDFYKAKDEANIQQIRKRYGFSENDIVLLFFGLVRKYKGLDLLLEVYKNLYQLHPQLKLLVVGEFYEPEEHYRQLTQSLGIDDAVVIENRYVPDEEVSPYFEMSDCVVLPYKSATQSGILSMAYGFGKPVVVTDVGELGAMVVPGKTGIVAALPEVEDLQKAIEQYLLLQQKGTNFKSQIEAYLQQHDRFNQVDQLFESIVEDYATGKVQENVS